MNTPHSFNTITDFLLSQPLTVDVEIDDGNVGAYPVKCVEFDASVLYIGVQDYFRLSYQLAPPELLIYLNMFLLWMRRSLEGERFCVVERFLDSAVILLFSKRFGSEDPFLDALRTARWLGEQDPLRFSPDLGITSGRVVAGFAGSPGEFTASVFGRPIMLAASLARMKPAGEFSSCITFPSDEWGQRHFSEVFPPVEYDHPEKGRVRQPEVWKPGKPRIVNFPEVGRMELQDIATFIPWVQEETAEVKAKEWFERIRAKGYYKSQD